MELSDYGRLLRKWALLIIAGTVLATGIGAGLAIKAKAGVAPSYQATAGVFLNYVTPYGTPYNATVSPSAQASLLSERVHDRAALAPLQGSPTFNLSALRSISGVLDTNAPQVTVTATATTRQVAAIVARRVAQYLAGMEDRRVASEGRALQRSLATAAQRASARYQAADSRYLAVCGCGPGANGSPTVSASTLRALRARLDLLEYDYQNAYNALQGANPNPIPPATVTPGSVHKVSSTKGSLLKTIAPAAILGFILSVALAAALDYGLAGGSLIPGFLKLPARPVKGRLRAPVIGHLPSPNLRLDRGAAHLLQDNAVRAQVLAALAKSADQTAEIVSRLVSRANPTLYITSPTHRDPKTETALSLGCALAQRGLRVIMVDGDPGGRLTAFLGLGGRPGLADFLSYPDMSLTQLLQPVDFNPGVPSGSLWLLPVGLNIGPGGVSSTQPPVPGDLDAWPSGMKEISAAADIVLVNGVPVLESSSMVNLASTLGGALVVIRREQADEDLVTAYDLLKGHQVRVLGLVVNAGDRGLAKHLTLEAPPSEGRTRRLPEPELQETS
ncbi:MAG TPA: hypothetical protein VFB34_12010 [Chloroflexota bacterium]|nr:hypothetical protein [Chloroflexota bacterium]